MIMDDNALGRRLTALKQELAQLDAPAHVGRRLDAAIEAARQGKLHGAQGMRRLARESWLAWPLALAAATQFIPLMPVADIAQTRGAFVVSAPVSRTMLAELGLPVSPARAAEPIASELLVRADGTVLAVRFLQ